jgi:hypothetical protein
MSVETRWHREGYERVQDCEAIVENNKRLQTEQQSRKSDMRHVGSIPAIWVEKLLRDEWAKGNTTIKWSDPEFDKLLRQLLDDPDFRHFRTDSGVIGTYQVPQIKGLEWR